MNVHPTKTEIKFEEDKEIYAILKSSVKQTLGKYNIAPSLDFEQEMGRPINGSSLNDQLKFVQWDLTNTEKQAGARLKAAKSAAEAAAIIDQFYERSAGIHRQKRIASANSLVSAVA